jgi:hypothetical protein
MLFPAGTYAWEDRPKYCRQYYWKQYKLLEIYTREQYYLELVYNRVIVNLSNFATQHASHMCIVIVDESGILFGNE